METKSSDIRNLLTVTLGISSQDMDKLGENDDLRSFGLNSISCIDLIVKLEEENGISISDEDLLIDNVCTINNIGNLLKRYIS
ncbi:MAG: acyl carrier protein [Bacillota bacterium]|nr:acyl carrier protein [Bacillota bacterium]